MAAGAWRVSGATALVRELSSAGAIYLQDEASQLVAETLKVKPGERVLDLCAAPGGKTTLLAGTIEDQALIVAGDRSAMRLETVIATTNLHGLTSIKPMLLDAGETLPFASNVFDRVLLDAPCSGTGTLRRNPEIRWRLSEADISAFAANQKRFLANAAEVVKPGGRLVYSTCSVERDENEDVIQVLDDRFRVLDSVRTWPHRQGSDGFFIAIFEKGQD